MAVIKMNFLSQALGMQTNVTVCLPSYSFADRMSGREEVYVPGMKYQVLWLLHGGTGDDSDYLHFSNITRYADDHKLAVVMPCDYNMYYLDNDHGKFMTFIAEELPKMCRALFPFSDKREDNFIGGLSMGSRGCQQIAIRNPQNYAAVLAMSGGSFSKLGGSGMLSQEERYALVDEHIALAKSYLENGTPVPKFFMVWGEKDFARADSKESSEVLKDLGYDVYAEEVPGLGHEWDLWDATLRKAFNEWLPIRHSAIYPGE